MLWVNAITNINSQDILNFSIQQNIITKFLKTILQSANSYPKGYIIRVVLSSPVCCCVNMNVFLNWNQKAQKNRLKTDTFFPVFLLFHLKINDVELFKKPVENVNYFWFRWFIMLNNVICFVFSTLFVPFFCQYLWYAIYFLK